MEPGDAEVHAYYERDEERERLSAALGVVEFERTKEIIARHLPAPPAIVADVGGGPGRYSIWLAKAGYRVHIGISCHSTWSTRGEMQLRRTSRSTQEGDARDLDLPDASVDAVLLLGPLYHLPQQADRIAALREAKRIVRAGGFVFVAAISRWAARLHGVLIERVHEEFPEVLELLREVERSGRLPPLREGAFAGYTHRPRELRAEARAAGLDPLYLVGVEGLAFALPDLETLLETGLGRQIVFDAARAFESVPELLGLGPHLILTAQRRA